MYLLLFSSTFLISQFFFFNVLFRRRCYLLKSHNTRVICNHADWRQALILKWRAKKGQPALLNLSKQYIAVISLYVRTQYIIVKY